MQDFMTADQAFEIETTQSFVELCAYLEVGLLPFKAKTTVLLQRTGNKVAQVCT